MPTTTNTPKFQDILDSIDPVDFYTGYIGDGKAIRDEVWHLCPFHTEDKPSFSYNSETGQFKCFGCDCKGHYIDFVMQLERCERPEAVEIIRRKYGNGHAVTPRPRKAPEKKELPVIEQSAVAAYIEKLWNNERLINYLREVRGLNDETIATHQLGTDGEFYTFPVWDEQGNIVNIRRYKPKTKTEPKKWFQETGATNSLYPLPFPDGERVLICEGEFDCLIARQNNLPAITTTGGCKSPWNTEWNRHFAGKIVLIAYDNDPEGCAGAVKVAEALSGIAASIRIIRWPEFMEDKADVSDWFVKHEMGRANFNELASQAHEYISVSSVDVPSQVKGIIPDRGFLRSYLSFTTSMMDACLEYHLAAGLAVLSAAIGNKVKFMGHGGMQYKLNLWTVLIGPSGDRKSTAINRALTLLREACPNVQLPNDYSRESLLKAQETPSRVILHVDEFSKLLSIAKSERFGGLIQDLTSLFEYTGTYVYETLKAANFAIKDPAPSILAASTPDWLNDEMDHGVIRGGFLPRFIFWPSGEMLPDKGFVDPDAILQDSIVNFLRKASELTGVAKISPDVADRYFEWQKAHQAHVDKAKGDTHLTAFYRRMPTYLLKFAILYRISNDMEIDPDIESLEQAIRTIEFIKRNLQRFVGEELVTDREYKPIKKVLDIIRRPGPGGIDRSTLIKRFHGESYKLDRILKTLMDSGQVTTESRKEEGKTKPTLYYVAQQ